MERRLAAILSADMAAFSRLIERDEVGVLSRQKRHRSEAIDPRVATFGGHIVKTVGDGILAEFPAAQEAVRCAIEIQEDMAERERGSDPDNRIDYRIGINLGDVVHDDGDVFGDGVNVAARLQALAEPGGVCISDIVHQTVSDRIGHPFRDLGIQRVKNITRPIRVWQWAPDAPEPAPAPDFPQEQRIQFARSSDGVQIAWSSIGEGAPLLKAPNWLNHLDYEWRSPTLGLRWDQLARHAQVVRFDQRGNGLSDWEAGEISVERMMDDMTAVADAAGLDRFALLGISQGGAFSIRYAVENPDRVTCMIVYGGYLRGRLMRPDPEQHKLYDTLTRTIRDGWGSTNPVFRHFFTSNFIPDAPLEVANSFDELQRVSASTENALRIWEMNASVDVTELARQVRVPTLVMHCTGERVSPLDEGRGIARAIPGATFVELPGNNHVLLPGTPAFERFLEESRAFLARHNV